MSGRMSNDRAKPDEVHRPDRQAVRRRRVRLAVTTAALAIVAAMIVIGILRIGSAASQTWVLRTARHPADAPTPTQKPPGIFSEVGGWIVYGHRQGIWAIDPSHPDDPLSRVRLSSNGGVPLAWSSDGSQLLISRESWFFLSRRQLRRGEEAPASQRGLFVLHADGTETHLVREEVNGASFSPDGTTVVFAPSLGTGIYLIDADGGVPRLLVEPSRRYIPEQDRSFRTGLYFPTFSPDGTRVAYFDGFGDNSHSLRVVNADGSDLHVLIDTIEGYRISNLVWSPDGTQLAFGRIPEGIYTIGVDGSGLTLLIPDGAYPYWSPDGSRISYQRQNYSSPFEPTSITSADGMHTVLLPVRGGGPWNPLVQPQSTIAEVPAASEGLTRASTALLVIALLALVVGAALIRRRNVETTS
jgi:WD40 repeat protein